jgi:hypothetical protein
MLEIGVEILVATSRDGENHDVLGVEEMTKFWK